MAFTGTAPNKTYQRTDGTRTGSAVNVTADGAGVNNTAALADNRENDIAAALTTSWQVNGDNQPTANLPMNTKKFTGMAQGSARTDSLRIDQVQDGDLIYAGTVGGTADAIELTTAPVCAPVEGMTIVFIPASDSTSTVTVDLNGNGAVALQYNAAALSGQELQAGLPARITHDGTVWQLENTARLADLNALAKTDGNIIVGDGTNWVAESGATARTSLGLGTGDSPQFTGIELGHASDTTITRTGAGDIAIEGNAVYRAGGTNVAIADGGTNADTAAAAFSNLKQAATTTATGVVEKATQAEVEAETADKYPDAALLKYHPGMAKFWALVTVSGGTPTLVSSYNVAGIVDTATGRLTVTIATDFSSANYAVQMSVEDTPNQDLYPKVSTGTRAAGSVEVSSCNASGVLADPAAWHVTGYGDQ